MNDSIILVQPPLVISPDVVDYPYHSDLAVVQAAAVLREAGLAPIVLDAFAQQGSGLVWLPEGRVHIGCSVADLKVSEIVAPGLFVVHYTVFHRPPGRDALLAEVLSEIRATHPNTPVLLADLYQSGEHYIQAPPSAILAAYPEVDAFLQYQAEDLLAEVCRDLIESGRPDEARSIRGVEVSSLSELPLPAWGEIDLAARDVFLERLVAGLGRGGWAFPVDGRTLPAITSRGCPYRCAHCSSNPGRAPGAPKRQIRLSAERTTALVDALVTTHGATRIDFLDEMVNVDVEHFDGLLGALTEHPLRFDFPNGMRADWVTPSQLRAMAGRITTLSVSAESGVQRVVDHVVDKKLDLGSIEATIAEASRLGISTLVHFIIGMPGGDQRDPGVRRSALCGVRGLAGGPVRDPPAGDSARRQRARSRRRATAGRRL